MTEASIPVDLFNPGQVFACLGFLEATEVLLKGTEGRFEWQRSGSPRFWIRTVHEKCPFTASLEFVKSAKRYSLSPERQMLERDGEETRFCEGVHPSKLREDGKPRNALLPIELEGVVGKDEDKGEQSYCLRFDYWTDLDSRRPFVRLWTATNNNSAAKRFGKLHDSLLAAIAEYDPAQPDPLNLSAPVAANFRLEPRRNWMSINAGYSPDKQQKSGMPIEVTTYPVVELFAALALTHARPRPTKGGDSAWRYAVWQEWLPPELARIAIAQALPVAGTRNFVVHLEAPNDGGDLSMTYASEEIHT